MNEINMCWFLLGAVTGVVLGWYVRHYNRPTGWRKVQITHWDGRQEAAFQNAELGLTVFDRPYGVVRSLYEDCEIKDLGRCGPPVRQHNGGWVRVA